MKKISRNTFTLFKARSKSLIFLIILYSLILSFVFVLPKFHLQQHEQEGLNQLRQETVYPVPIKDGHDLGVNLDNYTDAIMLTETVPASHNPFVASMSMNTYSRYWHGYVALLRPLLSFFSYYNIRYFNAIFQLLLFGMVFAGLRKRFNNMMATIYTIILTMISFFIFPESLQFTSVLSITAIALITVLRSTKKINTKSLLFLVLGSVINFFDLLTFPLFSLGIVLVVWMLLINQQRVMTGWQNIKLVVYKSIDWFIGYASTWFLKWAIASLVLRKNVIKDAIVEIFIRTNSANKVVMPFTNSPHVNRGMMLQTNFMAMFPKPSYYVVGLLAIVLIFLIVIGGTSLSQIKRNSYLVLISLMPFVWYMVLANHSEVHYWMTYRNLSIFVFGISAYLFSLVNWENTTHKWNTFIVAIKHRFKHLLPKG